MRRCGVDRQAGRPSRAAATLAALGALAVSLAAGRPCPAAGLVGANYQLNWDQTVNRTEDATKSTWTFKQTLDVKYRGLLSPVVENEIAVTISEDLKSEGEPRDVIKVSPVINLTYRGSYWSAGGKRTIDDSNEPDKNAKISDSYFVELFYAPPRSTMPDLKGKYTLNMDSEAGTTDTSKHSVTLSSVYKPNSWLQLGGDYSANYSFDRLKADSDTFDDRVSGQIGVRHVLSQKIKLNSEARAENSTGGTILTAGGTINDKHDQTYDWKNSLAFLPFRDTTIDASYDWNGKQNLETGEHDYTTNYKVAMSQAVLGIADLRGDFSRAVSQTLHTPDENKKIDDTWTAESRVKLTRQFDASVKYQKKSTVEDHVQDPTRNKTSGSVARSATLNGTPMKIWRGSVSYDKTDTIENGFTKTIDTKYSVKSTIDFKDINVILDPSYDIALKEDRTVTPVLGTASRDFKFKIAWQFLKTNNIDGKMDHTYGRKTDSSVPNIARTDASNLNFSIADPFPNWTFGIDVTRSATDTSGDDLPPDITATVGFKADYKFDRLSMGTNYKYDRKKLTDDSETFDLKFGWTGPRWDFSVTYTFNKTFSKALNEGYTLGIAFKYNL